MPQVKHYITIITILFSMCVFSQNTNTTPPKTTSNKINYHITQAEKQLGNYNYYKTQTNLDEALSLAKKANNTKSIGIIYAIKGKLQLAIGEEDEALKSLNKAIKYQRKINDNGNLGKSYKTIGDIYFSKKKYHQALDFYKASKIKFEKENLDEEITEALLRQGKTFILLNNYKKAVVVIEQALNQTKKIELLKTHSKVLASQGLIQNKLGDNEKAIALTLQSIEIAKKNNYTSILNQGYLALSDLYNESEDYKQSRYYLSRYIKISDSMRNLTTIKFSKEQEIQNKLTSANQELKAISKKLELSESENNIDTLILILSVALISILSLLTLSLYKNNNMRLKTNNMLHKKNAELIIAKEKAELASKTKANFLSTVTHELRTPLYAVTGLSDLLLDENPKPEQIKHLKSLKFSGDYLLNFINDILQINKIEANKVDIELDAFNLKKKINDIILALSSFTFDNNIKIHLEYHKNLHENYIADQIKISQILINLIGNAIKFTKNGDIWIRVYKIEEKNNIYTLRFEIEDNGIGISKEKQDHMFESFSQGSIEINRKYGGTGLGLSIVKGLIDILKGRIYVKSKLNKGTTFYFEIPLELSTIEDIEKKQINYFNDNINNIDLKNIKILIVEDNKINQMITQKILTKMKLKCDIVDNGEDAVAITKTNKYDIILMDIHMPGISGVEATKQIKSFNKNLTIFALSAVTIEDRIQEFKEAGFSDFISKPFKQEIFEKKLYNALAKNNATPA